MAHTFHLQFAYFPLPSYSLPQSSTTNTSCYFCPLRLIQSFAPKSLFCIFPTCRFISATVCASIVSPAGHRDVRSWRLRLRPIAPSVLRLRRGRSFGALAPSVALRPAILTNDLKAEPAKVLMKIIRNLIWLLLLLLGWWWWWWWWWWWCWWWWWWWLWWWWWWWWWWWRWRFSKTHCYVTILQEQDCQKQKNNWCQLWAVAIANDTLVSQFCFLKKTGKPTMKAKHRGFFEHDPLPFL